MENKKIHLVVTYIEKFTDKARHYYHGEFLSNECPMRVSFHASHGDMGVPLWFDSEKAAREYIYESDKDAEKEFYLIQEFIYPQNALTDEAKIIFKVKSDTWPILAEGETERAPGIWAHVRSIFLCDKAAAEDYVRRFNEYATADFELIEHNK